MCSLRGRDAVVSAAGFRDPMRGEGERERGEERGGGGSSISVVCPSGTGSRSGVSLLAGASFSAKLARPVSIVFSAAEKETQLDGSDGELASELLQCLRAFLLPGSGVAARTAEVK